ncbi:MAG: hypothetical protein EBY28_16860 [Betaproteobacteria bacterium]|nr:hypothetical protein [Betaproteobacteria bacterium]
MTQHLMKHHSWLTRAALIAALVGAAGLSQAQSTSSPAKKELTQKLLRMQQSDFEGLAGALAEQSVAQFGQQAGAVLQNRVPAEQREVVAKEIQAEFRKFGADVNPLLRDRVVKLAPSVVGTVLEAKLSEDEIKQLISALESPGFRKFQQLTPEIQRTLREKLVADTKTLVEPRIKALEQAVTAKLNKAMQAAPSASTPNAASAAKAAPSSAKK